MRRLALMLLLVGVAFAAQPARSLESRGTAFDLRGFDPYIQRDGGAPADPINLIFYGADASEASDAVHAILGWPVTQGSPMNFLDRGRLRPTAWQMGFDLGGGARYHLRIEDLTPTDAQPYVLAAVHHDVAAACGHVGTDFDQQRIRVAQAFRADGYPVQVLDVGNTDAGPQCDGSFTHGDGKVALIDLSSYPH
jgi:hypothetical protein